MFADAFFVDLDAASAALVKGAGGVAEQLDRTKHVVQNDWFEDIELERALRAGIGYRVIVAEDLSGDHCHASHWVGFTLPGMIDEPGSLAGMRNLPIPARGPLAYQRTSLAIFVSAIASVRNGCADIHHRIVRPTGRQICWPLKRTARRSPRQSCERRRGRTGRGHSIPCRPPSRRGPADKADSSASTPACAASSCAAQPEIICPTVSGVASCKCVRPIITTFEYVFALASSVSCNCRIAGTSAIKLLNRGDVHHGRKHIVGRLAAIDVVVRMNLDCAARELACSVGDHLVGIHIRLRAGAGLEHRERKLGIELSVNDFLSGSQLDRLCLSAIHRVPR